MDRNEIEGKWKQIRGRVREEWGELTDDDLDQIEGRWDRLVGRLQERYGKSKEEASREAEEFFEGLTTTSA